MTRETKLGLVVGVSFVSLAGFVAYNTWFNKDATPDMPGAPPQPVAQLTPPKTTAAQPKTPATSGVPGSAVEVPMKPAAPVQPGPLVLTPNNSDPIVPPISQGGLSVPSMPSGPPSMPTPQPVVPPPGPGLGGIAPPQPGLPGLTKPDEFKLPGAPAIPKPASDPFPALGGAPNPPTSTNGMQPPSTLNLDKGPPIPLPPSEIAKGPIPPAGANPTFPTAKDPLYGDPIIPKTPGTLDVKSPLPPLGADPNIKPPQNPLPPLQGDKPPISPIVPGNAAPSPVGVGSVPPVMGGKDPTPPGIISQNPTQPNPAPAPIPTPVGQPAPASKAQVEQHMETIYTCTAADADFAALSQKFYNGSDKYAQALVEYNKRSNPFGKDAVALAPRVQPGTKVIVPPVHVLEREFPAAVSSSKQPLGEMPKPVDLAPTGPPKSLVPVTNGPASGQAVPATQPPTEPWGMPKSPAPSPVQPVQTPAIPAPSQPPATFPGPSGLTPPTGPLSSNAATPGVYVVPPPGKHYWQIAQETLGDPKRWSEIFNLNQHYNPEQMVPAGAQLRLPGASTPVVNAGGDPRAPFLN